MLFIVRRHGGKLRVCYRAQCRDFVTVAGPGLVPVPARVYLLQPWIEQDQAMPSFDVVSDFDAHEARNGVDQANREVTTRFDFKGTGSKFELDDQVIQLTTQSDFQLKQMMDILHQKLSKRGVDISCLEEQEPEFSGSEARQKVILRRGIDADRARKLVKEIKNAKLKVQAAVQGDKLRVTGKKRDDLQAVISMLKESDIGLPLQYENFRD
jgi:uncharacterized protein YajQ (UPF0234 family)